MNPPDSFAELMDRLRRRDDDAANEVFQRFAHRLIGLARLRLDARLRQKVDPEDVLQSVFKSFFLRHAAGRFDLNSWDGLWALLAVITVRKCGRINCFFRSAGRDADVSAVPIGGEDGTAEPKGAGEPSPEEATMLAELVERLLRDLPERDRPAVVLGLQGHTAKEISSQLNRPERSIYRILQRVRSRIEQMQREDATDSTSTQR